MGRAGSTYVYHKLDNEQVSSMSSVFYITQKDCSKQPKQISSKSGGNVFILDTLDTERSVLFTEAVFLKEREGYVMSLEITSGNRYKEIYLHN